MLSIALHICKNARAWPIPPGGRPRRYNHVMSRVAASAPWLVGGTVVALAFAAGVWLSSRHARSGAAPVDGLLWPDPPQLAAFHLVDDSGQPFTLDDLRGRWTLMFFGFTHCPDVCPTTLEAMARAHAALQDNPAWSEHGQVVFVSVDPDRDDGEQIAQYVHYFSPDFIGATGAATELEALTRSVGVLFMKVPLGEGAYTMDHSAGIFFVAPDTRLVSVLTPPHGADAIAARFAAVESFIGPRL